MKNWGAMILLLTAISPWPVAAQSSGVVEGTVLNSVSRAGIPGVEIRIFTSQGKFQVMQSDGGGRFRFVGLEPASYSFTLEKEGYEIPFDASDERKVQVGTDGQAQRIEMEMLPLSTLVGRVVTEMRTPAAGLRVEAVNLGGYGLRRSASTGDDGSFELTRLAPGQYQLRVVPYASFEDEPDPPQPETSALDPGKQSAGASPSLTEATKVAVITYYPWEVDPARARAVLVGGLTTEGPYEIELQTAEAYPVKGLVLDEAGDPVGGVRVALTHPELRTDFHTKMGDTELYLPFTLLEPEGLETVTGPDGKFALDAVPEGNWTLQAEKLPDPDARAQQPLRGVSQVRILRGGVDDAEVKVEQAFLFAGEVVVEGGRIPQQRVGGGVLLLSTSGQGLVMGMTSLSGNNRGMPVKGLDPAEMARKEDHFPLYFTGVTPGEYRVVPMPNPLPGFYAAEVFYQGRNVLGQVIRLTGNPSPLQLVVRRGAGTIEAPQRNGSSTNTTSFLVTLPADPASMEPARSRRCTSQTVCQMRDLPPGAYWVGLFDRVDRVTLTRPELRGDLTRLLKRVTVRGSNTTAIELDLNRWPE